MIKYDKYIISDETMLKAKILTHGIMFTDYAMSAACDRKAKRQNLVYNMPLDSGFSRPQELLLSNQVDGYEVVVSCVSPGKNVKPLVLDCSNDGKLFIQDEENVFKDVNIDFVREPSYYYKTISNGENIKRYVSSCGLDELNIFPWKGCSISKMCLFCGANSFISENDISSSSINIETWNSIRDDYIRNLCESISIAKTDPCFTDHMHVILIAGNLKNSLLNFEADIFADIAEKIRPFVESKSAEGLVLVITPPPDISKLIKLYNAGITKVVFNLEVLQPNYFEVICPGKAELGYYYIIERLKEAVRIWGKGNVWSNLVYGLEPQGRSLEICEKLADFGIVIGANVLHLDKGNRLSCDIPNIDATIDFFYNLEIINSSHGFEPYYCPLALRTSLSNEAHEGRILKI